MAWRMDVRLNARGYLEREERASFRAGYADGFHGKSQDLTNPNRNAYSAGYNEGLNDSDTGQSRDANHGDDR